MASDARVRSMRLNFESLTRHLDALLATYFASCLVLLSGLAYSTGVLLRPQFDKGLTDTFLIWASLTATLLLADLLISIHIFVKLSVELRTALLPREADFQIGSGRLRITEMKPIAVLHTLRTISRTEPYGNLMPNAIMVPSIAAVLALGSTLVLYLSPTIGVLLLWGSILTIAGILILWLPAFALTAVTPFHKLLSALSVMRCIHIFEAIRQEQLGKTSYFIVKWMLDADERFMMQGLTRYARTCLHELAPASACDLSPYFTTIYVALSLGQEPALGTARSHLDHLRLLLRKPNMDFGEFLSTLVKTSDVLSDSWRLVEQGKISIQPERQFPLAGLAHEVISIIIDMAIKLTVAL